MPMEKEMRELLEDVLFALNQIPMKGYKTQAGFKANTYGLADRIQCLLRDGEVVV